MSILITGGTGYIGSHTVLTLLEKGKKVIIIDNLSNSSHNSIDGIKKITGLEPIFYEGDILDKKLLKKIFSENSINAVIHFAGLKSVADSVLLPLNYYENNISGTLCLLEEMKNAQVKNLIFSSSATVYGEPQMIPLIENCKTGGTTNPYGTSKFFLEQILSDLAVAYPDFRITILRYFNPVGAHPSGIIGEDPNGTPCNLMPYICQVAAGKYSHVSIFGSDYPTKDGTGVRDFIHVMDLAEGHVAALKYINKGPNLKIYNLGTGRGYSVLELLKTFERMTSISVPYVFTERRAGDIAECWSDPTKARVELDWVATRKIDDMVRDAWNWQIKHFDSYKTN
ncbi:TPA: UDP-glucose 4-epimerase GalE [Salmonella enterica subsp. houtenae]|nr:UDP-glucose 4-epimerase GalE [Salmonella enterica subsp. houtenae]ECT3982163.1 UDP-glucose 4-epimerase GalE [Salmonella enterica subsp. houtenae serovar 53:z4,z23:-]EKO1018321.1 UDP-glucose 4-epimerase GalE [Salmonella enterica subsp. enterica]ECF6025001.1 UDP-glucose 4-epimerase GalE [Salmonella enterica subsp. houtenae]ECJ2498298.1 UDP-glucose 4-epimerase GalE [Salmonella enterica subsp. houtenae]